MSFPSLHFQQRFCCASMCLHEFNIFNERKKWKKFSFLDVYLILVEFQFSFTFAWKTGRKEEVEKKEHGESLWFCLRFGFEFSSWNSGRKGILSKSFTWNVSGELTQFKCMM